MMSKLKAVGLVGVLLGCWTTAAGCSSDETSAGTTDAGTTVDAASLNIAASEFGRTCAADADCVAVYEGNVCAICKCSSAVIAASARAAYQMRFDALQAECGPRSAIACGEACIGIRPHCNAGTCEIGAADGG